MHRSSLDTLEIAFEATLCWCQTGDVPQLHFVVVGHSVHLRWASTAGAPLVLIAAPSPLRTVDHEAADDDELMVVSGRG